LYVTVTLKKKNPADAPGDAVPPSAVVGEFRNQTREPKFKPGTMYRNILMQNKLADSMNTPATTSRLSASPSYFVARMYKMEEDAVSNKLFYIFMPPGKWHCEGKTREADSFVFTVSFLVDNIVIAQQDSVSFKMVRIWKLGENDEEEEEEGEIDAKDSSSSLGEEDDVPGLTDAAENSDPSVPALSGLDSSAAAAAETRKRPSMLSSHQPGDSGTPIMMSPSSFMPNPVSNACRSFVSATISPVGNHGAGGFPTMFSSSSSLMGNPPRVPSPNVFPHQQMYSPSGNNPSPTWIQQQQQVQQAQHHHQQQQQHHHQQQQQQQQMAAEMWISHYQNQQQQQLSSLLQATTAGTTFQQAFSNFPFPAPSLPSMITSPSPPPAIGPTTYNPMMFVPSSSATTTMPFHPQQQQQQATLSASSSYPGLQREGSTGGGREPGVSGLERNNKKA
jgi:hypothetical protein